MLFAAFPVDGDPVDYILHLEKQQIIFVSSVPSISQAVQSKA